MIIIKLIDPIKNKIDNTEYGYIQKGEGGIVVLLPGTIGDENIFNKILDKISINNKIIVFNHLKLKSISEIVNKLNLIFEREGISDFILGGTSVGGWIAQHYASKYPDCIRGLILGNTFSSNSLLRKESLLTYRISKIIPEKLLLNLFLKNVKKSTMGQKDEVLLNQYFKSNILSMGKSALRQRLSWSLEKITLDKISNIIPKLIVASKEDPLISNEITNDMINQYPEAEFVELNKGSHFPYLFNSEIYGDKILDFINKIN